VKDKKGDTNRLWDALSLLPPSIHTRWQGMDRAQC
jgi:hypothetical protein